jgi:uncharacterized protein YggE
MNDEVVTDTRELTISGTAILRVEPDFAVVSLAVVEPDDDPKAAYGKAHRAGAKVRGFVAGFDRVELRSSSVHLGQVTHRAADNQLITQFTARVNLTLLVKELAVMEPLIVGVLEAGANQLVSTEYSISRLKETRAQVRLMALSAAREKALALAEGAGAKLGPIMRLHETHFDPNRQPSGHVPLHHPIDSEDQAGASSPGSIAVGACLNVVYKLM